MQHAVKGANRAGEREFKEDGKPTTGMASVAANEGDDVLVLQILQDVKDRLEHGSFVWVARNQRKAPL